MTPEAITDVSVLSRVIFDPDTTPPSVPGNVTVTALSTSALRISWNASTDTGGSGLAGYRVYRSTTQAGTYTQIGSDLSTASTSYDDTGLSAGATRYYRVAAFDGNGNVSAMSAAASGTTQGDTSSGLTPALVVEYVDLSNVRRTVTVADGITTITGIAPFMVHFDASGTRSVASDGNTEAGAWYNIGYRLNYGENIGGRWDYPQYSDISKRPLRDEDLGPPIFGYVYTVPGSYTARLKCRDSRGVEKTISLNVVVQDPGPGVDIPVGLGSWPSLNDNTVYNLDGNYTSFGELRTGGKRGIVLRRKPGAASIPVISGWYIEDRRVDNANVANYGPRTINCRMYEVDVIYSRFTEMGFDYCGFVKGRCRGIDFSVGPTTPQGAYTVNTGFDRLSRVRYVRGAFFWDCGEMLGSASNAAGYVFFGDQHRAGHFRNVVFTKHIQTTNTTNVFRSVNSHSSARSCMLRLTVPGSGYQKMYADSIPSEYNGVPIEWRDDDLVGAATGPKITYPYPTYKSHFHQVQFGAEGSVIPQNCIGYGTQTNSPGLFEASDLCTNEDCVFYHSVGGTTLNRGEYQGRNLGQINVRLSMGNGPHLGRVGGNNPTRIPPGYNGPYIFRDENPRPVPSPF